MYASWTSGFGWGGVNVPVNLLTSCMLRELWVCLHIYIYTYIYINILYIFSSQCIYIYIHIHVQIFFQICIRIYIYTYICTDDLHFYTYIHTYIQTYIHTYIPYLTLNYITSHYVTLHIHIYIFRHVFFLSGNVIHWLKKNHWRHCSFSNNGPKLATLADTKRRKNTSCPRTMRPVILPEGIYCDGQALRILFVPRKAA